MKIGQLASKSGVPASTIRFYEQKGLMPHAARRTSGYRIYDEQAVARLQSIKFSQSLGFALDDLPALIDQQGGWDHQQIMQRLNEKQQEITALLTQLTLKKQRITSLINQLSYTWQQGQCMQQDKLADILTKVNY